jgi:hypothetical protein
MRAFQPRALLLLSGGTLALDESDSFLERASCFLGKILDHGLKIGHGGMHAVDNFPAFRGCVCHCQPSEMIANVAAEVLSRGQSSRYAATSQDLASEAPHLDFHVCERSRAAAFESESAEIPGYL